jgi:hypothetical protein
VGEEEKFAGADMESAYMSNRSGASHIGKDSASLNSSIPARSPDDKQIDHVEFGIMKQKLKMLDSIMSQINKIHSNLTVLDESIYE